ncbi:MAG: hypothetical protein ABNH02_02000 [Pseudomonadales bacterium]
MDVYQTLSYRLLDKRDFDFFSGQNFDLGICTGWQRLIPDGILDSFKFGVFGWHGSGFEFPNGRGRSPLNWSLRLGLDKIHHNCFRYGTGADTGDVFESKLIPVERDEYIADIQDKALLHILDSSLRLVNFAKSGAIPLRAQPNHPSIELPKLSEGSGEMFPDDQSVESAYNLVRSCSFPFPGAYIIHESSKVRVWRAKIGGLESRDDSMKVGDVEIEEGILIIRFTDGFLTSDQYELIG